ncbi:MAG TPA: molybdate ABC transporter substrate-binding protein [Longimicrobium sp.]|nr:molybdate ABC transporter substrate-binding protein [Longimicrobium sp.]
MPAPVHFRGALFAALLMLAACRGDGPARATVTVSAAASLREAVTELEREYEAANPGVDVRANFGASGALRRQIEQGAPVDIFISAAIGPMDALEAAGLIDRRTRRVLAGNELVLIVPAGRPSTVSTFADLAKVKRVALGAPASVPAGEYADEVLRNAGVAREVRARAVYAQDVRQVLAFVASGNADAGVVYRTDAASTDQVRIVATAPAGSHRPIVYPVALVAGRERPEAARAFVGFLLGPRGRAVLRARGFVVDG